LSIIFNICRKATRIPQQWKESTTTLIYKGKGEKNDTSSWRPISLQNCLYKIYAAIIAKCIASWAISEGVISTSQKGFLPYEGCFEHSFLLQACLQDSRRKKKNVAIAWLDLKNAFGSVPIDHLLHSMEELGPSGKVVEVVKDIYTGSTTRITISNSRSDPISCSRGVKQGCPLSPILFNLAVEQQLRGVEDLNGGYMFDESTLTFNIRKCGTLHCRRSGRRQFVAEETLHLGQQPLPILQYGDHYRYLDCDLGADPKTHLGKLEKTYIEKIMKVMQSKLAEWQKLEAIRRYIHPTLDYVVRTMLPNKTWANNIDGHTRRLVKKALRLPKSACKSYIHCPWKFGGLGIPCVADDLQVAWASQAYKYLTNKDSHVKSVATQQLLDTTRARTRCTLPSPDDVLQFTNERSEATQHSDIRSLWSLLPGCLSSIGAKLQTGSEDLELKVGDTTLKAHEHHKVSGLLRDCLNQHHLEQWKKATDQGRCANNVSRHPSSNHWLSTGKYTSFAAYRFAIKGRINTLPVYTVQRRTRTLRDSINCRKCHSQPETLAHVLNHCRDW